MDTNTTTQTASYVVIRHDNLNRSYYRVTDQGDGTELVEYRRQEDPERTAVVELAAQAAAICTTTEVKHATCTEERAGVRRQVTYYTSRWAAPRYTQGVHRQHTARDPQQLELAARCAAQSNRIPEAGERWVVADLEGYRVHQARPLEHRDCGCFDGTTTYREGIVAELTYWADNSIDVHVLLDGGQGVRKVAVKAPSGDACF